MIFYHDQRYWQALKGSLTLPRTCKAVFNQSVVLWKFCAKRANITGRVNGILIRGQWLRSVLSSGIDTNSSGSNADIKTRYAVSAFRNPGSAIPCTGRLPEAGEQGTKRRRHTSAKESWTWCSSDMSNLSWPIGIQSQWTRSTSPPQ